MKQKKKNILRCAVFLLVTVLMLAFLSDMMKSNSINSVINISGFEKEPEDTLDAVFIGASEVYTGYSPTLAWEEYGYTSYDLASHGIAGNVYLPLVKEALRRQDPKVLVIEVNGFLYGDSYYEREAEFRNVIDDLPWSANKIEAIQTLVEPDQRLSYYFPLSVYHANWSTPTSFLNRGAYKILSRFTGPTNLKGYSTMSYACEVTGEESKTVKDHLTEKNKQYLDELLQYCRDAGIEQVLFYRVPHAYTANNSATLESIWQEVESYGYDTLDCTDRMSEIGIDPQTDFYNIEHLNLRGTRKLTSYLGEYLTEHYGLGGDSAEKTAARWDKCAKKADAVLAQCESDMEAGIPRWYLEWSCYVTMPEITDMDSVLN